MHQKFDVGGMSCAACQSRVEKVVSRLPGVQDVAVNLLSGSMAVDFDESVVSAQDICTAVDNAGYSASPQAAPGAVGASGSAGAPAAAAPKLESPTKKLE